MIESIPFATTTQNKMNLFKEAALKKFLEDESQEVIKKLDQLNKDVSVDSVRFSLPKDKYTRMETQIVIGFLRAKGYFIIHYDTKEEIAVNLP